MATRNVVPRATSEGGIGTTLKRWATAFIDTLTLTNALSVGSGGTGQTTAQTAIDTLSAVSGGSNEDVLTKDTVSGHAIWKTGALATTTTEGTLINGATAKATPVDADMVGLMDSAAANILKKLSWANIKATLKVYFDTLYAKLSNNPPQNLITNSGGLGFVMSNGTLANQGSQLIASWSNYSSTYNTFTTSGANISSAIESGAAGYALTPSLSLTKNKLYKLVTTLTLNSGAAPVVTLGTSGSNTDVGGLNRTLVAGVNTIVFKYTGTSGAQDFMWLTTTGAGNWSIASTTLYEVEPQIAANNALAMDKWWKDASATGSVLTRKFNGGLLDTIEMACGAAGGSLYWDDGLRGTIPNFYLQFAGRSVVFGVWVTCSSANKTRIVLFDSGSASYSSYHTGSGNPEWLEVTRAISATPTSFYVRIDCGASATMSFRQPMLTYGSYLGSGNYTPRLGEEIILETPAQSQKFYTATGYSDGAVSALDIQADSLGAIPADVAEISLRARAADSASAAATGILGLQTTLSGILSGGINVSGRTNSSYSTGELKCPVSAAGTITNLYTAASGSSTITVSYGLYSKVKFR